MEMFQKEIRIRRPRLARSPAILFRGLGEMETKWKPLSGNRDDPKLPKNTAVSPRFHTACISKLGRAARLWNGPSLRGHKWGNGARNQNKIKMACKALNAEQACRWGFKPFIW